MTYHLFAAAIPAGYLLGSVPFGLIIAKAHGKDLRAVGSGNIGATNVARALGRKWAYLCFVLDVAKGLIPMLATMPLTTGTSTDSQGEALLRLVLWLAVGCAAILGHIFPVWVKFKGGKGVATSLGVVLGLWPYYTLPGLAAFAVWGAFALIWRYVSLASIAAAVSFPLCLAGLIATVQGWQLQQLWPLLTAAVVLSGVVVLRHRANIARLLAGTEHKILTRKS